MAKIVDIIMPESDEGTESFLESWIKQVGDPVKKYEPILEINTDKVSMEVAAPASGILKEILKEPNAPTGPGEVLGRIEVVAEASLKKRPGPSGQIPANIRAGGMESAGLPKVEIEEKNGRRRKRPEAGARETRLSPLVRKMLKENSLHSSEITGTGRDGRITANDVKEYLSRVQTIAAPASDIPSRMVVHRPIRIRTANHMVESMLKTAPHVTAMFDADMSAVMAHREKTRVAFEKKGVKLTYTAYFVDAAVKALQAMPEANSRWHDEALEIFEDYNIGVAAATDAGLIVPVIHKAQNFNLFGIAEKLQDITTRAHKGKLTKADIQNGTFSITNHGVTGSLFATPIINQPQSAILGIGKLEKRVVVVEMDGRDATQIRPRLYVTLTVDHRALDGFQANMFLTKFVETLASW